MIESQIWHFTYFLIQKQYTQHLIYYFISSLEILQNNYQNLMNNSTHFIISLPPQ